MTNDPQKPAKTEANPSLAPLPAPAVSLPEQAPGSADFAPFGQPKPLDRPKRTFGERVVDWIVYPFVNNFLVFAISVVATYLTSRGGPDAAGHLPHGKFGEFCFKRGEWVKDRFKPIMGEKAADMAKMVFFSFADGTLVAPFVKLLEDRREEMARWFDRTFKKEPLDESAYQAEPKQTWGSVIEGRLVTSALVVPTAVVLSKTGLNQKLFEEPGLKLGEYVAKKPNLAKYFGKLDKPELFKIITFEAFYTSVCTLGLYIGSRMIARHRDNKNKTTAEETPAALPTSGNPAAVTDALSEAPAIGNAPRPHVSQTTHLERLAPTPMAQHATV